MPLEPQSVLVCTPHPDDAEIGAGGTIAKWVLGGAKVVLVLCTNGDKGSSDPEMTSERLAAIRQEEQLASGKVLGVSEVVFLHHPDSELEDTREFRGELVREIRRHQPDVVMTTDPFRRTFYQHRDHRVTGQATADAVFPLARDHLAYPEHKLLGLEPHKTPHLYFWGTDAADQYVELTEEAIDLKIKALASHVSQVGGDRQRDLGTWLKEGAKRTGKEQGFEFAEGFRVIEMRR